MTALKLVGAEKTTRTKVDTISFSIARAKAWTLPPFQRPLQLNARVREIAELIKADGGVIPGILTLGMLGGREYLVDGQHRREAFFLSGCEHGYSDVRICEFDSMAEMADEFVTLNSQIARLKPDDILRGLEAGNERLRRIRKACPWVGYSHFRANADSGPILSASLMLRVWLGSSAEAPVSHTPSLKGKVGRAGPAESLEQLTDDDMGQLMRFLSIAFAAWGRDPEHARLYGSLNLGLCGWLFRRTVLTPYSAQSVRLTDDLFKKCLAAAAASTDYLDFLAGRQLRDRDRSPGYRRLRDIFVRRIEQETGARPRFPKPEWAASH